MHGHIRTRRQRIFNAVGLVFLGLFVAAGTTLLVLFGTGYNFNFQTREVVQNGLVLVGSEPVNAAVYLNGESRNGNTPHRMTIPAGQHTVRLTQNGYRQWERWFDLAPAEVLWLNYPLLIPNQLTTSKAASMPRQAVVEPSADSSRLAIGSQQSVLVYQTNNMQRTPIAINIADELSDLPGRIIDLTWSDNGARLLVTVSDGNRTSYVYTTVGNRPEISNQTALLDGYRSLRFVPGSTDQLHGLRDGSLWQLSLDARQQPERIVETAERYSAFGNAVLTWASSNQRVVLHQSGRNIVLDAPPVSQLNDLSLSRRSGELVAAITASDIGTVVIISPGSSSQQVVSHQREGSKLLFSPGAGYLMSHSQGTFQVFDFERHRFYAYSLPVDKITQVRWASGAHLIGIVDGKESVIFDFDGQNLQRLNSAVNGPIVLSPNRSFLLHLAAGDDDGQLNLISTDLRP